MLRASRCNLTSSYITLLELPLLCLLHADPLQSRCTITRSIYLVCSSYTIQTLANSLCTAPNISKLLPNWAIAGTRPKVDAFGPLFLRKNNILECQVVDEQNKEIALLKGTSIVRKRNCFHSFSFVAPEHPAGRVWIRARYKDRDFGEAKPFEYWCKYHF